MKAIRNYVDKIKPNFEKGGKLESFNSFFDAIETFLFVPNKVSKNGVHVHDPIDLKRTMIIVIVALIPSILFGAWNVGYQNALAYRITSYNVCYTKLLRVADNDAFDFVLSYRSRPFFYNLPLVFTGIGNIEDYEIDLFRQHIFGVIESNGYPAILRSIKQLFPGHRKVYVMLDKSNTNQVYKNDILKNKTKFEPLELVFTDNLNEKELFDTIANADLNSVLYFVNISRFNDTTLVDPVELCSKIVAKTILPVFTGYDIHSVKEALGGSYNNGITAGTLGGRNNFV